VQWDAALLGLGVLAIAAVMALAYVSRRLVA
jgi:hypothetical protein